MKTLTTLIACALVAGCVHHPKQPPVALYTPQPPPKFEYKESTKLYRMAADRCLAENQSDPTVCANKVGIAESAESGEQHFAMAQFLMYQQEKLAWGPQYPAPAPATYSSPPPSGPVMVVKPKRGLNIYGDTIYQLPNGRDPGYTCISGSCY
jgi:hypothetical protein